MNVPGSGELLQLRPPTPIFFLFFYFFWPCLAVCGILVPQPGIEPGPTAMKALSPNHWTAREFPPAPL